MNDNGNPKPSDAQSPPFLRIEIIFVPSTGEFNVDGPLDKPVAFLGMLEAAKMGIDQNIKVVDQTAPRKPIIEVPTPGVIGAVLKGRQS